MLINLRENNDIEITTRENQYVVKQKENLFYLNKGIYFLGDFKNFYEVLQKIEDYEQG